MRKTIAAVATVVVYSSSMFMTSASANESNAAGFRPVSPVVRSLSIAGVDTSSIAAAEKAAPSRQWQTLVDEGVHAAALDHQPELLTATHTVDRFDAVGLTWEPAGAPTVVAAWVRVLEASSWSEWNLVPMADLGPDPDSAEARAASRRVTTEPIFTSGATALQVRIDAADGDLRDVRAELIDAGRSPADATVEALPSSTSSPASTLDTGTPGLPPIISRAQWGADESLRNNAPTYMASVKVGVVHHTASTNSYSASDAAAQIRAIYAYHTQTNGWSDIAYNVLVDRFGRIYEGRWGGLDRSVMSAATGGLNRNTFSVSALGEFGAAGAPGAMVESIAQILAWKLAINYANPVDTSQLTSAGHETSRYAAGQVVTFPNIIGHRDNNYTSCPGQNLYGALDYIRSRVMSLIPAGLVQPSVATTPRSTSANGAVRVTSGFVYGGNWGVKVFSHPSSQLIAVYAGTGWSLDMSWPMINSAGQRVPEGTYQIVVEGEQNGTTALSYSTYVSTSAYFGNFESVMVTPAGTVASGWVAVTNGDTATVALVVDGGPLVRVTANGSRPDVGAAYPSLGPSRGFAGYPPLPSGVHLVCAWAERAALLSSLLGCRYYNNPGNEPIGNVDWVAPGVGSLRLAGWSIDRHSAAPVSVRAYVDGVHRGDFPASTARNDVGAAYPAYGPNHGFDIAVPTGPGTHTVCVNGLNVGAGSSEGFLRCVTGAAQSGPPIGNLEAISVGSNSLTVRGWTLDPDATTSIPIHVYVDGGYGTGRFAGAFMADVSRSDVNAAYPLMGSAHGFNASVGLSPPTGHVICVYAINVGPTDSNRLLGCGSR